MPEEKKPLLFDKNEISQKDWRLFAQVLKAHRDARGYHDLVRSAAVLHLLDPDRPSPLDSEDWRHIHNDASTAARYGSWGKYIAMCEGIKINLQVELIKNTAGSEKISAYIKKLETSEKWSELLFASVAEHIADPGTPRPISDTVLQEILKSYPALWQDSSMLVFDAMFAAYMRTVRPEVDLGVSKVVWNTLHDQLHAALRHNDTQHGFEAIQLIKAMLILSAEEVRISPKKGLELIGHKRHRSDDTAPLAPEQIQL